jgi:protein-L-isoaspartate(D-aspartate) O-methyltransferase
MLSGSVSIVPAHLLEKLKIGGRLVAIVGEDPVMHATVIERTSAKDYKTKQTWDTVATRLVNFPQVSRFQF